MARACYETTSSEKNIVLYPSDPELIRKNLYTIYEIFRSRQTIAEEQLSCTITEILTALLSADTTPQVTKKSQNGIADAITHINKYFYKSISLQELADIAALSPYYFSRVFSKETGMTPHKYLIMTRINNAKFLLKTSQMSIKEIAFRSGFTDESAFCTAFKKEEGVTPNTYRSLP